MLCSKDTVLNQYKPSMKDHYQLYAENQLRDAWDLIANFLYLA